MLNTHLHYSLTKQHQYTIHQQDEMVHDISVQLHQYHITIRNIIQQIESELTCSTNKFRRTL